MKTIQDYKNAALLALKGNWGPSVLLILAYFGITVVPSAFGDSAGAAVVQVAVMICAVLPLHPCGKT